MRIRCPICSKTMEVAGIDDLPSFPFCSERCKLVDLGRWIDGDYRVPLEKSDDEDDSDESMIDPDPDDE
ncbi:MAG: DNA gyrase inhibitor YacG [Isosphaeraceae bacterium]|nr:DNA gyrase inhibitor YacG [Isosphaeraceae bacterium]